MTEQIVGLFHESSPLTCELKEICVRPDDCRWIVYVMCPEGRFVIKIASNDFTTVERVNAWPKLIAEYGCMGYYSPEMRRSISGRYAEIAGFQGRRCVVWEEEFSKFSFADGKSDYFDGLLAFMGSVAQRHLKGFPGKSGWVRLEPFTEADESDEIEECLRTFDKLVPEKAPGFVGRWLSIRELWLKNRQQLAAIYDRLPTSVFQGDWGAANILVNGDGSFAGVIDYNLAGEDVVLNMFISMCMYCGIYDRIKAVCEQDLEELTYLNRRTRDAIICEMLKTLRTLRKYYAFTEAEAEAAPLLYKYITAVEYAHIDALKSNAENAQALNSLFDFIDGELRREDIGFREAMLG